MRLFAVVALALALALSITSRTASAQPINLGVMRIGSGNSLEVSPNAPFTVQITFENFTSLEVQAWSYAIEHDETALELLSVNGYTSSVFGIGLPGSFELAEFFDGSPGTGLVVARVLAFDGSVTLPPSARTLLGTAEYQVLGSEQGPTELAFVDDLFFVSNSGVPLSIDLILGPFMSETILEAGMNMETEGLTIVPSLRFLRGKCSPGSSPPGLADVLFLLEHIFRGGPPPSCPDACDLDDSGFLTLGDALGVIQLLFEGTGPSLECATDTVPDTLLECVSDPGLCP